MQPDAEHRSDLMARHAEARARRDGAALGSDAYREAAEEVARIEIEIAAREEPPPPAIPPSAGVPPEGA
jgi:hypothetical protein